MTGREFVRELLNQVYKGKMSLGSSKEAFTAIFYLHWHINSTLTRKVRDDQFIQRQIPLDENKKKQMKELAVDYSKRIFGF